MDLKQELVRRTFRSKEGLPNVFNMASRRVLLSSHWLQRRAECFKRAEMIGFEPNYNKRIVLFHFYENHLSELSGFVRAKITK